MAADLVVTLDSFITSTSARQISSTLGLVTAPTSALLYGPSERTPYVPRIALPPFFFNSTTFIDEDPISIPTMLPSSFLELKILERLLRPSDIIFLSDLSIMTIFIISYM